MASMVHGYVHHDGHQAVHLRDRFAVTIPDIDWIEELRADENEWLVFTSDLRISRNKAEREAFRRAGLRAFGFAKGYQKMPLHQRCASLIYRWPEVVGLLDTVSAPFMFEFPVGRRKKFRSLI